MRKQYVTNSSHIILLDYPFTNSHPSIPKKIVVARYELNYKKGKIIAIGIFCLFEWIFFNGL
jgi:hypothetical protein